MELILKKKTLDFRLLKKNEKQENGKLLAIVGPDFYKAAVGRS